MAQTDESQHATVMLPVDRTHANDYNPNRMTDDEFAVVLARIGHTVIDPAAIRHEDRIVWLVSPDEIAKRCRYVREGRTPRCTRTRPIGGDEVLAYAVLRRDAPRPWLRRFWYINDGDPFPIGEAPCEAVDVRTIAPRVPGRVTERVLFGKEKDIELFRRICSQQREAEQQQAEGEE